MLVKNAYSNFCENLLLKDDLHWRNRPRNESSPNFAANSERI